MNSLIPRLAVWILAVGALDPASGREERSVQVSGHCRRALAPDRSSVVLTAESLERDAAAAARRATETFEKLRQKIREASVPNLELETTEFTLSEQVEWEKQRRVTKGYRARAGLKVSSSDFSFSSRVIAIAAAVNVRDIGGLSSFVSDEALDKARFECLEEAVRNARAKAERLAAAAGARVGAVLSIHESPSATEPGPQPVYDSRSAKIEMMSAAPMTDGPTIEAGKTRITTSVIVSFGLR